MERIEKEGGGFLSLSLFVANWESGKGRENKKQTYSYSYKRKGSERRRAGHGCGRVRDRGVPISPCAASRHLYGIPVRQTKKNQLNRVDKIV